MKTRINALLIISLLVLCVSPESSLMAKGVGRHTVNRAGSTPLHEIIKQAEKILSAQSQEARLSAKAELVSLMKKKTIDPGNREKIGNAVGIILGTTESTIESSKQAYRFLVDFAAAIDAQKNLFEVAEQTKEELENAPADQRKGMVDAGLNAIQNAAQVAREAVNQAYSSVTNMLRSAEKTVDAKVNVLSEIDFSLKGFMSASDEEARAMYEKQLTDLMNSKDLDAKIKSAIASDMQTILQTKFDKEKQASQVAYKRLNEMITAVGNQARYTNEMIEQGIELVEEAPVGNIQKIKKFVSDQLSYGGSLALRAVYGGASMFSSGYIERQALLQAQMYKYLNFIAFRKDQRSRELADRDFKALIQNAEIDVELKEAIKPLLAMDKKVMISRKDALSCLKKLEHFDAMHMNVVLHNIMGYANNIIRGVDVEKNKKDLHILAHFLYQRMKDEIWSDVETVLNTTDATIQASKDAFGRLSKKVDGYQAELERAKKLRSYAELAIGGGGMIAAEVALFKLILIPLAKSYRTWANNYADLKAKGGVFDGILTATRHASREDDKSKYHDLVGILEGLGVGISEIWNPEGSKIKRIEFYRPDFSHNAEGVIFE